MTASNKGQHTAMALDTLGNAYLYLRESYATVTWNSVEGGGLLLAADALRTAFVGIKEITGC